MIDRQKDRQTDRQTTHHATFQLKHCRHVQQTEIPINQLTRETKIQTNRPTNRQMLKQTVGVIESKTDRDQPLQAV